MGAAQAILYVLGFWVEPPLTWWLVIFWIITCGIDMGHTIHNTRFLQYEQNNLLRFFVSRLRFVPGVIMTLGIEAALVLLSPFILLYEWDPSLLSLVAAQAGLVHIAGYVESRNFLKQFRLQK